MTPTRLPVLWGYSTQYPSIDFETYSEAGFIRDPLTGKVSGITKTKSSIAAVGTAVYAEHSTCEILSIAYNIYGENLWLPGMPPPAILLEYIASGGILQAWHSYFEYKVWKEVCEKRMGWPSLPLTQLRDTMAKARAFALPGKLTNAGKVLGTKEQKIDGGNLIKRFCCPQSWTKKNKRNRIDPLTDSKGPVFYEYNVQDIRTETNINAVLPDLSEFEERVFQLDQIINERGVQIDIEAVSDLLEIIEQAIDEYNTRIKVLTNGTIETVGQVGEIVKWLHGQGLHLDNLDEAVLDDIIPKLEEGTTVRQVLELRQAASSASVKKLYAMQRQTSADGRAREQFVYCGADRTGRFSAGGLQLHNFPSGGADLIRCENGCDHYYGAEKERCPWCGMASFLNPEKTKWNSNAVESALYAASPKNLTNFNYYYPDTFKTISGCLRGLITAAPGKQLICSDFSAIEAVVLAELAGETWRQEVFRTHGKIYELSASKISGVPFEEFLEHKERTGEHHPLRKKIGKVAELASGYKGWIGAWKKFGADKYFTDDDEIKQMILKWRADNPNIVRFWNNIEEAFYFAVNKPTERFQVGNIYFGMIDNKLIIQLPSGRKLVYHEPWATREQNNWGRYDYQFSYMRWNNRIAKGPINSWIRVNTWVGETVENIDQAISRDILCNSLLNLEAAGYPIVMHIHDEIVAEVPIGYGSIEDFEQIGSALPDWCKDWPVRLKGGWIGQRFKKE